MPTASDLFRKLGQPLPPLSALLGHEDNPGEKVLVPLLQALGFDPVLDIDRKPTLKHGILGPRSWRALDFGILPRDMAGRKQYAMVADTKPVNEDLEKWVEKMAGYCGLAGAVRGVLMDGLSFVIIEPTRGVVEWKRLEDIPSKAELEQLINAPTTQYQEHDIIYATRITESIDEEIVTELAQRCHEIIRSRKGLAVPDRLYEFSKLLIARIIDERRFAEVQEGQLYLTASNLEDIRKRGGSVQHYEEERFKYTQSEVGIFSTDEGIDLPEDVIEEIIAYLDEHQLWSRQLDVLGQVYEKFLADTMTGQELGQYFTPRPIVETIVEMIDPRLGETILDPACGTGGFLIHALQYLVQKHNLSEPKHIKEAASHFYGIDTFSSAAKLCEINLWLHGDSHENVSQADSLNYQTVPEYLKNALASPESDGLDIILTNPPFGARQGNRLSQGYVRQICEGWHNLGINLFECAVTK